MSLPAKLAKRLEPYGELGQNQSRTPALTLDEFFDGNCDEGSIGCNLSPHPGIPVFRATFEGLLASAAVRDIRFPVVEWIEGLDWPFTDKAIVVTSLSAAEVAVHLSPLSPDETAIADDRLAAWSEGLVVPHGLHAVVVWWD